MGLAGHARGVIIDRDWLLETRNGKLGTGNGKQALWPAISLMAYGGLVVVERIHGSLRK